jgi:hypothetical protein
MGPRLWLLWPVWLAGAFLHRLKPLSVGRSRVLLLLSLSGLIGVKISGIEPVLNDFVDRLTGGFADSHLRYSGDFAGDYLVAITIAGAIHAARGADIVSLAHMRRPIAAMASISFSMYLTHYPLFLFFNTLFPQQALVIGVLSLGVIIAFGLTFERNKMLLRRGLAALWPLRPAYR